MKTAEEIIHQIQELSPEEQQKVTNFVFSQQNDDSEENYSDDDIAKILQAGEEAENGIGTSPELEGEEAIQFLRNLRNA